MTVTQIRSHFLYSASLSVVEFKQQVLTTHITRCANPGRFYNTLSPAILPKTQAFNGSGQLKVESCLDIFRQLYAWNLRQSFARHDEKNKSNIHEQKKNFSVLYSDTFYIQLHLHSLIIFFCNGHICMYAHNPTVNNLK